MHFTSEIYLKLPTTLRIIPDQFWVKGWDCVDGRRHNTTVAASLSGLPMSTHEQVCALWQPKPRVTIAN